jgi:hypothetical protein
MYYRMYTFTPNVTKVIHGLFSTWNNDFSMKKGQKSPGKPTRKALERVTNPMRYWQNNFPNFFIPNAFHGFFPILNICYYTCF